MAQFTPLIRNIYRWFLGQIVWNTTPKRQLGYRIILRKGKKLEFKKLWRKIALKKGKRLNSIIIYI